jgi:hypothetical protein
MPGCDSCKRLQCRRIVTPAMRQAAFKASVEALVNDPNAVEHIASITISQKQMHMTEEMHQASKAWLQQLHEWGLILKVPWPSRKGRHCDVSTSKSCAGSKHHAPRRLLTSCEVCSRSMATCQSREVQKANTTSTAPALNCAKTTVMTARLRHSQGVSCSCAQHAMHVPACIVEFRNGWCAVLVLNDLSMTWSVHV